MCALPRELGREDVQQRVDRAEDAPIGEAVADEAPVALGDDDALLPKDTEVSRGQRLAPADGT
jgi:hypothetical protein